MAGKAALAVARRTFNATGNGGVLVLDYRSSDVGQLEEAGTRAKGLTHERSTQRKPNGTLLLQRSLVILDEVANLVHRKPQTPQRTSETQRYSSSSSQQRKKFTSQLASYFLFRSSPDVALLQTPVKFSSLRVLSLANCTLATLLRVSLHFRARHSCMSQAW